MVSIGYLYYISSGVRVCVLVLFLEHCKKFKGFFFYIKFNLRNKRSSPVSINLISVLSTAVTGNPLSRQRSHFTIYDYRYYNFCYSRAFRWLYMAYRIRVPTAWFRIANVHFPMCHMHFLAFHRTVPVMFLVFIYFWIFS